MIFSRALACGLVSACLVVSASSSLTLSMRVRVVCVLLDPPGGACPVVYLVSESTSTWFPSPYSLPGSLACVFSLPPALEFPWSCTLGSWRILAENFKKPASLLLWFIIYFPQSPPPSPQKREVPVPKCLKKTSLLFSDHSILSPTLPSPYASNVIMTRSYQFPCHYQCHPLHADFILFLIKNWCFLCLRMNYINFWSFYNLFLVSKIWNTCLFQLNSNSKLIRHKTQPTL